MSDTPKVRLITRAFNGALRIRNYSTSAPLLQMHTQIGIDDCSTNLSLRGLPVFRELVGPIPSNEAIAQYESPEVFETLTRDWTCRPDPGRRRRIKLETGLGTKTS